MNKIQNQFLSIEQLKDQYLTQPSKNNISSSTNGQTFSEILNNKSSQTTQSTQGSEIKFSKHASGRLATRQIELDESQMARISDGMQKAGEKGIKDSLLIMDSLTFIVNVPSNTVITAMDQTESRENIFTNIDGAVIV